MNARRVAAFGLIWSACAMQQAPGHGPHLTKPSASTPRLACAPELADDSLRIGGDTVKVPVHWADAPEPPGELALSVYPIDAHSVAVAPRSADPARPTWRTGKLWRLLCEEPLALELFVERAGADFGQAWLDTALGELLFTDQAGVSALNLQTRALRELSSLATAPGTPAAPTDIFVVADAREPRVRIGAVDCADHCDWVGQEHLLNASDGQMLRVAPVTAVASGRSGVLWLGTGGRCERPGVTDLFDTSAIYRSADEGSSWRRITVPGLATGVQALWADEAGRLLVLSGRCDVESEECVGCGLHRSDDEGRSWSKVQLPIASLADFHVTAFESIDRFSVTAHDEGGPHALSTLDGGKTWRRSKAQPQPPIEMPSRVRARGRTYERTPIGLVRRDEGKSFDLRGDLVFRLLAPHAAGPEPSWLMRTP